MEGNEMTHGMTDAERMELVERHAVAEIGHNWDDAWDTLHPDCYYDYLPLGIRISGRPAIEEHWHRTFSEPAMAALGEVKMNRWIRDEDVVIWTDWPVQ